MLYLYAYTNHKENLDSLRRVKALYEAFKKKGIEAEILLNEYRAQLLARDWGLPLATTIETIKDIDAVATVDDIVIIDSLEALEGKVLEYGRYFKKLIYINPTCEKRVIDEAENIQLGVDGYIYSIVNQNNLEEKTLFIYGDSDYDKTILKNLDIFKNKNIDLYWGNYFFVKYEDEFTQVFNEIIEPEEYYSLLSSYRNIFTSSIHIAIEANANGLNTSFLELKTMSECEKSILKELKIPIVKNIIINNYNKNKSSAIINNIVERIVNISKNYM